MSEHHVKEKRLRKKHRKQTEDKSEEDRKKPVKHGNLPSLEKGDIESVDSRGDEKQKRKKRPTEENRSFTVTESANRITDETASKKKEKWVRGDAEDEHKTGEKAGGLVGLKVKKRKKLAVELEEERPSSVEEVMTDSKGLRTKEKTHKKRKEGMDTEKQQKDVKAKKEKKKKKKEKAIVDESEGKVTEGSEQEEASVHPALVYLHNWLNEKSQWNFKKVRQVWLLQNMFNKDKVGILEFLNAK